MNIQLVLTGCGNNEVFIENNWMYKGLELCIYLCLDDCEELYAHTKYEGYLLEEGEPPIKAFGYLMLHPDYIHPAFFEDFGLDYKKGDNAIILSELYSEIGGFIPIPMKKEEYSDIGSAEKDIHNSEEYFNAIMNNAKTYIHSSEEGEKFLLEVRRNRLYKE
jgi:hypothetical protein